MKKPLVKTVNYFLLAAAAVMVLIPFFWMLGTALKSEAEALHIPPTLLPKTYRFDNFAKVIQTEPLMRYFLNTLIVSAFVVLISTMITVLAAYAFARLEFKGKDFLFAVVLIAVMLPQEIMIITNFMTIAKLKWLNTFRALILPYCVNAFNIFLLRQTMKQIPEDLYIAARIDGLTNFKYLWKVVLPVAKPTILTTMLLSMIWIWDTYAWPNLVTTQDNLRLISNGLKNAFTTSTGNIQYELQMAAATLVTIPLILVFVLLRKYIFSGITRGGMKG